MYDRETYMHINFQHNWVSRSVKTVHTNLFATSCTPGVRIVFPEQESDPVTGLV